MESKTALVLAIVFVSGSIMTATMAYGAGDEKGKSFEPLWAAISELEIAISELAIAISEIETGSTGSQGDVFVRWGNPTALSGTTLLYSGMAMGSLYTNSDASGSICIASDAEAPPIFPGSGMGDMYPASIASSPSSEIKLRTIIQCAVLFSETPTLEIWGKTTGPVGWTKVYSGFSMSPHFSHSGPGDRICVDGENYDDSITTSFFGAIYYPSYTILPEGGKGILSETLDNRQLTCAVFQKNP